MSRTSSGSSGSCASRRRSSHSGSTAPACAVTRAQTVEDPTNDEEPIATTAVELLRAYAPPRPVRLLGVRVASFEREPAAEAPQAEPQLDLGLDSSAA
jgi:nucleotidyltransferase/DNA polymerase involved in DNA repair